jgi:hypothetical protein
VVVEKPMAAFQGDFTAHWWILVGFIVVFYVLSVINLLRKDKAEA